MDSFELNKIFGAMTGALAVFLGIGFITKLAYAPSHSDHHELAFAVPLGDGAEVVVEAEPELSLPELMAAADAGSGERVFNKCKACHSIEAGGGNGQGPALHGIMGREIATVAGFSYSDALTGAGGAWTWEAMNGFLEAPKDWAPGTRMSFAGLKDAEDRANVMAFLNANSDAPIDPPTE